MNVKPMKPLFKPIVYPDRDGKPMSDRTKQGRWIVLLFINLQALFRDREDVFIAADLLWYPVEGNPERRNAPDVLVVFGRPKGDRGSYKQWEEDAIPVTVVFEILSPGNTHEEMVNKFSFYEEHGVEEYYIYDPDHNQLTVYRRQGEVFRRVRPTDGHVSPSLGIRFDLSGAELIVRRPDGQPFQMLEDVEQRAEKAEQRAEKAEQRAEKAEQRAEKGEHRVSRLVELGRKARLGQASSEELAELERLEAGQ